MEEASVVNKGDDLIDLPPGFRFHPTDEELITHYLTEKVMNNSFSATAIGDADLNKCEPWDLPKKAKMGEKEWYFFCQRDRKYPTGMRTNRATESGYWKATGKDKEIYKGKGCLVGMKKTLVFYSGRAPKGEKSNWVMHEFRLEGKFSYYNFTKGTAKDEWVVCRVFHKNAGGMKRINPVAGILRMKSFAEDDVNFDYSSLLPPLMDLPAYSERPGENEFKGIPMAAAIMNNDHQRSSYINQSPTTNSIFYSQIPPQNAHFSTQNSGYTYLHPSLGFERGHECKVEQSMVSLSQDTGLCSTDMNNEISSVVSKHDNRSYDDIEGFPASDFVCLWD